MANKLPPKTVGLGYLKRNADPTDYNYDKFLTKAHPQVAKAERKKLTLFDCRGVRLDQGQANSCVSFALARAIFMSITYHYREDIQTPSPGFIYYNARRIQQVKFDIAQFPLPPVVDGGCYPKYAMEAVQEIGFVPWDMYPYKPELSYINKEPGARVVSAAVDQSGFTYGRLSDDAQSRKNEMIDCDKNGFPVLFGAMLGKSFMNAYGDKPINQFMKSNDDLVGGHMMAILGYSADYSTVIVDNWWGPMWGKTDYSGTCIMPIEALLNSEVVYDMFCVKAAPTYSTKKLEIV
jgi:hypothetical protein